MDTLCVPPLLIGVDGLIVCRDSIPRRQMVPSCWTFSVSETRWFDRFLGNGEHTRSRQSDVCNKRLWEVWWVKPYKALPIGWDKVFHSRGRRIYCVDFSSGLAPCHCMTRDVY